MVTLDDLERICPQAKSSAMAPFVDPLNAAMQEFEINNALREAAFIAQMAHESGCFRWVKELASGAEYEGRTDLGNTEPGDGIFYKGRGLIQITGKDNYRRCGDALGLDLVEHPELLEQPEGACRSAAWFWRWRGLNALADAGDFKGITKRINGGYNGYQERLAFYTRAQEVLT